MRTGSSASMTASALRREHLLVPDWPAPTTIRAFSTTRAGGVSSGRFGTASGGADGLNLGAGEPNDVAAENRRRLRAYLPAEPLWLEQVHGTAVVRAQARDTAGAPAVRGDAVFTTDAAVPCVIRTADCLPVFLADQDARAVGLAHAGWRGMCDGVIEACVGAMRAATGRRLRLIAALGPAIGAAAFEVGDDVRERFLAADASAGEAFVALRAGKWSADLYALARRRLAACGVDAIYGRPRCTFTERELFYSYRRDGQTGRMAHVIWLEQ